MFARWYTSTLCCLMWVQMCIFPSIFQFNIFCLVSTPSTTFRLIYHVWIINCYCCHLFHFILFLLLSIQMIAQFYCHFLCVYKRFFVCTVSNRCSLLNGVGVRARARVYLSRKCVKGHYFDGSKNTTLLLLNSCVIYLLQTNVYLISNLLEFMAIGYQFFFFDSFTSFCWNYWI